MASSLDDHVKIDLKMTPTIIDLSLYCQFEDDTLWESTGVMPTTFSVYERLNGKAHSDGTLEQFETTENMYHIYQDFYMSKIE